MGKNLDLRSNRIKFVVHGFFFSTALKVAEPSTVLPLIIKYFTANNVLIGLFSSLVRGGAVLMQLYMAYFAQTYKKVLKPLRWLFFFRVMSWLGIGLSLYFFAEKNVKLTLWLVGSGFFMFSFFAGFGTILFHELLGKIFSNKYRGATWGYRQIFMGIGGFIGIIITWYFFKSLKAPLSFAYAFLLSSGFMLIGYLFLGNVKEDSKINISSKESSFIKFLYNSFKILKYDRVLSLQILVCLISFSYLFVFPFIVTHTKIELKLGGLALGSALPLIIGNITGNFIWVKLSGKGKDKTIVQLSFIFIIISLIISIVASNIFMFIFIYLFAGAATDGFRLSFKNLILSIAPEEKRPVYFAVQNNITSLGMFFSIPGGILINNMPFNVVISGVIIILLIGFGLSFKLTQ